MLQNPLVSPGAPVFSLSSEDLVLVRRWDPPPLHPLSRLHPTLQNIDHPPGSSTELKFMKYAWQARHRPHPPQNSWASGEQVYRQNQLLSAALPINQLPSAVSYWESEPFWTGSLFCESSMLFPPPASAASPQSPLQLLPHHPATKHDFIEAVLTAHSPLGDLSLLEA